MLCDSTPNPRHADAVEAVLGSQKTRHVAVHHVCAVNIIGSSFPNEVLYEERDIERSPVNCQEDCDERESEYVAPKVLARTLSTPNFWGEIQPVAGPKACQVRTADGA